MPPKKKTSAIKQSQSQQANHSDSDDDHAQPSLTQAQRVVQSLPEEDVNQKVNDLVQYLLMVDHKKLPIKRQDIVKNVLKEHSRGFNIFIQKAKEKLKMVFGISLEEIENKNQKNYILVTTDSLQSDQDNPHICWSHEDNKKMGVVMVMLSVIIMHDDVAPENVMFNALKKLGLSIETPHKVFGDVKKLITQEFVRKGYVEYTRIPQTDPAQYEFRWGPRAQHETSTEVVMEFVKQIYENSPT